VSTTNAEKRNDSSSPSNRLAVGGSIRATSNRERILPKDEVIAVATTPAPTITTTALPTTTAPTISSLPSATPSYWPTYLTYLPTVSDVNTVGVTVSLPTEIGMDSNGVTPTPTTTSDAATTAEIAEIENEITVIENEIANIESNEEKNAAAAITISDVVGETTQSSSESSIKFDQESILVDGKFRC
jgi:hypothetical protein